MIKFVFNNKNSFEDMNCVVVGQIDYPIMNDEYEFINIIGRKQGSLKKKKNEYQDKKIKMNLRLFKFNEVFFDKKDIIKWLKNVEDDKLFFMDEPNFCYKVKDVKITNFVPKNNVQIEFGVEFTCEPFMYKARDEVVKIKNGEDVYNDGDEISNPIIEFISQEVIESLQITINDETFTVYNTTGKVIIDSNLFIATNDGVLAKTSGKFPSLAVGKNRIAWIGDVEELKITKNCIYRG